ncbi:MAG: EamA family transporter [Rubrivivax sp.]|nr:EamA family transporter [Rubrivivax sp.]
MSNTLALPSPAVPRLPPVILACLFATWVIWGSTYLAIKWALVSFPPFFQMGTRFIAAGLVLGLWAAWRGAAWPTREQWFSASVLGALMLGGGYGATALAETSVSSGLVVAFIAVVPALVALGQWPYGIRPSRREWSGIVLGLAGVLMLTRGQGFAASWSGLAAIAFACITWCAGSLWALHGLPGGRRLDLAPGAAGYASEMLVGGLMLLAVSWLAGEQPQMPPDARSLACWIYLVVAGSLIGFSAYMVLLQRTGAALASSYTFVNPVIGLVLGVAIGGEVVSTLEWAAAGVVLAGVVLLLSGTPRSR